MKDGMRLVKWLIIATVIVLVGPFLVVAIGGTAVLGLLAALWH